MNEELYEKGKHTVIAIIIFGQYTQGFWMHKLTAGVDSVIKLHYACPMAHGAGSAC